MNRTEVTFYWHEDVDTLVNLFERDERRSHEFIPPSTLPSAKAKSILQPLMQLYTRRENERKRLQVRNEEYYNELDDKTLTDIIAGKGSRPPRCMIPYHLSSTVVQYSARDLAAAFEALGWEVIHLPIEYHTASWRFIKTIWESKPDLFININHFLQKLHTVSQTI